MSRETAVGSAHVMYTRYNHAQVYSAKRVGGKLRVHLTCVALLEVTWCMVVCCTQNAPKRQQFHVAPAMPALYVPHFGGYSKTRYKKLFTHVESHASALSLLESGE